MTAFGIACHDDKQGLVQLFLDYVESLDINLHIGNALGKLLVNDCKQGDFERVSFIVVLQHNYQKTFGLDFSEAFTTAFENKQHKILRFFIENAFHLDISTEVKQFMNEFKIMIQKQGCKGSLEDYVDLLTACKHFDDLDIDDLYETVQNSFDNKIAPRNFLDSYKIREDDDDEEALLISDLKTMVDSEKCLNLSEVFTCKCIQGDLNRVKHFILQPNSVLPDKDVLYVLRYLVQRNYRVRTVRTFFEQLASSGRKIDVNAPDENGKTLKDKAKYNKGIIKLINEYETKYLKKASKRKRNDQQSNQNTENETIDAQKENDNTMKENLLVKIKIEEPQIKIKKESDQVLVDESFAMTFEDIKPVIKLEKMDDVLQSQENQT